MRQLFFAGVVVGGFWPRLVVLMITHRIQAHVVCNWSMLRGVDRMGYGLSSLTIYENGGSIGQPCREQLKVTIAAWRWGLGAFVRL